MNTRIVWPALVAALVTGWNGFDFLFLRDLTGQFTYFGSIPSHDVDGVMGFLGVISALLIAWGVLRRGESCMRVGFVLGFASYIIFAIGLLAQGLLFNTNPSLGGTPSAWFSSMTPGLNYLLLSILLLLAGLRSWSEQVKP